MRNLDDPKRSSNSGVCHLSTSTPYLEMCFQFHVLNCHTLSKLELGFSLSLCEVVVISPWATQLGLMPSFPSFYFFVIGISIHNVKKNYIII
jgi:hypothetical protein